MRWRFRRSARLSGLQEVHYLTNRGMTFTHSRVFHGAVGLARRLTPRYPDSASSFALLLQTFSEFLQEALAVRLCRHRHGLVGFESS
jgi:hypothetical protein